MAIRGILFDLDGTVYTGRKAIPGAAEFINTLESEGIRYLFVTNRANRTPEEVRDQLVGYGIQCRTEQVLTSSHATALHLKRGTYYPIGENGLVEALTRQGMVYDEAAPDYVIVSFDRQFTYDKLKTACRLIGKGATFIATNPDRALPTEDGLSPGTGALVAAVAAGSNTEPLYIGKPERLIFDLAVEQLGLPREELIAVGDNIHTDVPAGSRADIRTVLILTGASTRAEAAASPIQPTWVVEHYAELAALVRRQP